MHTDAVHRTLPLGSVAVVHSLTSGRHVTVRINDRGPFARGRILTFSLAGAQHLGWSATETTGSNFEWLTIILDPKGWGTTTNDFADLQNAQALFAQVHGSFPMGVSLGGFRKGVVIEFKSVDSDRAGSSAGCGSSRSYIQPPIVCCSG